MDLNSLLFTLRFISLGMGVVTIVLTAHSFHSEFNDETFFFVVLIFCTIFSLALVCGYLSALMNGTLNVKYLDLGFHVSGGTTLLISSIFMMAAAIDRDIPGEKLTVERTISALFGIQTAIIYGVIATLLFKSVPNPPSRYGEGLEWEDPLIETVEAKKMDFGSISNTN